MPATIAAFEKGEPWLKELCAYIAGNKRLLAEFLAANVPEIKLIEGHATYLCWLDIKELTEDDEAFQKFLRKNAKLFVSAGSAYGAAGKGFLRINLACPRALVKDGLERMRKGAEAWKKGER